MRARFTVVRIPPASLPEQVLSGTVQKGFACETASACSRILFFASAGVAHAAPPVRMVVRDVGRRRRARSRPRRRASTWSACTGRGRGTPWFRTRGVAGAGARGSRPTTTRGRSGVVAARATPSGPAPPTRSRSGTRGRRDARARVPPLEPAGPTSPERALQIAGSPTIITRAGWHADEEIRRAKPQYRADAAARGRAPHGRRRTATRARSRRRSCAASRSTTCKGNGWDDIGYNFLVDACGQVFEGRYGGIEQNVVGAHSRRFNTGSVGVVDDRQLRAARTVEGRSRTRS